MKNNKTKVFWILIGIGVLIVIGLILVSNIINVGDKLRRIDVSLEIAFYVISVLVVYFLIVNPLRIILFAPTFSIETVLDEKSNKTKRVYKKVIHTLLKSDDISDESRTLLMSGLKDKSDLKEALNEVYVKDIKKQLNTIILKNAKTVLISTAISQNGKFDMLTVLAVNLKMIKEMVLKCGFRPSLTNLGKLSANILATALIAEGLEDMNFNELFPNTTGGILADIPFIKPIMSSIMQGISNGLLTLRIGLVTRKYLFEDAKIRSKREIRRAAFKESVLMLPVLVKESLSIFPERIKGLFGKKENKNKNQDVA